MEQKKIKKLSLKKETVANLSSFEQNNLKGGGDNTLLVSITLAMGGVLCPGGGAYGYGGGGGNDSNACSNRDTCNPTDGSIMWECNTKDCSKDCWSNQTCYTQC